MECSSSIPACDLLMVSHLPQLWWIGFVQCRKPSTSLKCMRLPSSLHARSNVLRDSDRTASSSLLESLTGTFMVKLTSTITYHLVNTMAHQPHKVCVMHRTKYYARLPQLCSI